MYIWRSLWEDPYGWGSIKASLIPRVWQNHGQDGPHRPIADGNETNQMSVKPPLVDGCHFSMKHLSQKCCLKCKKRGLNPSRIGKWIVIIVSRDEYVPLICHMSICNIMMRGPDACMLANNPSSPPINIYWAGLGLPQDPPTPPSYPTVAVRKNRNGEISQRVHPSPSPFQ